MKNTLEIRENLRIDPYTLRFSGEFAHLERPYIEHQQKSTLRRLRYTILLSIFVYLIFILVDFSNVPDQAMTFLSIRLFYYTPLALIAWGFTYSRFYVQLMQLVMLVFSWLGAFGLLVIHTLASKEGFYSYRYAILFTLIFVIFFFTMRFAFIMLSSVGILLLYNVLQWTIGVFPADIHLDSNILYLFIVLFGSVFAYANEHAQRETYLLTIQLRQERDKVATANAVLERRVQERTESLVAANAKLADFSYKDQLTGLYNRRYFHETLDRLRKEAIVPIYIVVADINGLKLINDTFGFLTGDAYILKAVEALQEVFDQEATLARLGGDEFAVIQTGITVQLLKKQMTDFVVTAGQKDILGIPVSVSLGHAIKVHVEDNDEDLFSEAENRMFSDKLKASPSMHKVAINRMLEIYHDRHPREEDHAQNVSLIAMKLGRAAGLSERNVQDLKVAGLYHDIGKITIDDRIFTKPGKLTEEEIEQIRHHPEMGYRILMASNEFTRIADYILHHHEWINGNGYPRGIRAQDIPIQSRILSVADAYEAITASRSFRPAETPERAIAELKRYAGIQFDPELVLLLETLIPELELLLHRQ